ncbi:MAG TPA: SDR family oxidoreductase [Stenotrophomonas sp.]|jgi:NADP-dependent 3-hydroxy acid dehydrogenase YdfG
MSRHHPLDEQVIVVTGASSGIGLATVLLAAERGAKVVAIARSGQVLEELAQTIAENGGQALPIVADVADREQLESAVQQTLAKFGRIDTWINNAGVAIYGLLQEVDEGDSRRLFDVNFWGVVNGSLLALPHLVASQGVLVNVGSEASEAVVPWQGMYSASKHAVKGFTDGLRIEAEQIHRHPVSIVLIQPTAVDTPYPEHARNYMSEEPKLPPPLIDAQRVADAILEAAVDGGRDVKVGALASANIAMSRWMPRLADRLSAARGKTQQQKQPARRPEGTLYTAGESGRVQGRPPA